MTDRPIPFSAPMVRAILDGRKTQHRVVLKPQPEDGALGKPSNPGLWDVHYRAARGYVRVTERDLKRVLLEDHTPYAVGDRLWVREAWAAIVDGAWRQDDVIYRADGNEGWKHGWRPSIHMPRWASRITLEVTGVRVERLQDISEADAEAEGIEAKVICGVGHSWTHYGNPNGPVGWTDPRQSFASLWTSLHGPGAWEANPWVAVIEFKRINQEPSNG